MFVEPHLGQGQVPRWWPSATAAGATAIVLLLLGWALGWNEPWDAREQPALNLTHTLAQAEQSRQKGDLHRALTIYSQALRLAAWFDDWEGLLHIACGLKKSGKIQGSGVTAQTVLMQAMVAAERKRSRTGLGRVSDGFVSIGDFSLARVASSRIEEGWPEDGTGARDPTPKVCEDPELST